MKKNIKPQTFIYTFILVACEDEHAYLREVRDPLPVKLEGINSSISLQRFYENKEYLDIYIDTNEKDSFHRVYFSKPEDPQDLELRDKRVEVWELLETNTP
jgi:hypothetical protein